MSGPIDVHAHLYCAEALEAYGEPYRAAGRYFSRSKAAHHYGHPDEPIPVEESALLFRAAGIDKALILNIEAMTALGVGMDNMKVLELCQPHEDVFRVFAAVDPHKGDVAAAELAKAVDAGAIGLKLHPGYQDFVPDELASAKAVYRTAQDLGIPILFHQGTTRLQPSYIRPCRPVHLAQPEHLRGPLGHPAQVLPSPGLALPPDEGPAGEGALRLRLPHAPTRRMVGGLEGV